MGRRPEAAGLDRGDGPGQLVLERSELGRRKRCVDRLVGTLEQAEDDLDLLGAVPQRGDRVHETLEPVFGTDDLVGRPVLEAVRLVVGDQRPAVPAPRGRQSMPSMIADISATESAPL